MRDLAVIGENKTCIILAAQKNLRGLDVGKKTSIKRGKNMSELDVQKSIYDLGVQIKKQKTNKLKSVHES